VHFPRILLFFKVSEVNAPALNQWRVEFAIHVMRCEFGLVQFNLSKCKRVGGKGWMALWDLEGASERVRD
jgi:hypothetical protein